MPEEILTLVEFGIDHPGLVRPDFWRRIEVRVARAVRAALPAGAHNLDIRLDPDRTEIVLAYAPPPPKPRRTGS